MRFKRGMLPQLMSLPLLVSACIAGKFSIQSAPPSVFGGEGGLTCGCTIFAGTDGAEAWCLVELALAIWVDEVLQTCLHACHT